MREPNPDRVLERISALQYSQWRAYEQAFGPIDGLFEKEILSQLHELLQFNNQLTGAAITGKGKKNPAGKFHGVHRPWAPRDDAEDDLDDDEEEASQEGQIALFDREVFGR